jgi:hypothetical protein
MERGGGRVNGEEISNSDWNGDDLAFKGVCQCGCDRPTDSDGKVSDGLPGFAEGTLLPKLSGGWPGGVGGSASDSMYV